MRCYNCINSHHKISGPYDLNCSHAGSCLMRDVELRETYSQFSIKPGCKIRFKNEKSAWKIKACDDRWIIATRGKQYTICDLQECIRGKDNLDKYDYIHDELSQALKDLKAGDLQISLNKWSILEIEEVK